MIPASNAERIERDRRIGPGAEEEDVGEAGRLEPREGIVQRLAHEREVPVGPHDGELRDQIGVHPAGQGADVSRLPGGRGRARPGAVRVWPPDPAAR